jgi:hypothetical protein
VVLPTPAPFPGAYSPGGTLVERGEGESESEDELKKTYPPLAKDIFPQGVRVIAVQGLPEPQPTTTDEDAPPPAYTDYNQQKLLLLLIPNQDRETLSLALQKSDSLIVSIMARGDDGPTPGFTYWDFEEQFEVDRAEVLGIPLTAIENAPSLEMQEQGTAPYYAPIDETGPISSTMEYEVP